MTILTSLYTWNLCATGFSDKAMLLTWIGIIAGIIFAIFTSFKPEHSKITAPIYALCEGLVVGSVSYAYGKASKCNWHNSFIFINNVVFI